MLAFTFAGRELLFDRAKLAGEWELELAGEQLRRELGKIQK